MGARFWKDVAQWLIDENEGDAKERGCVNVAASMPNKIPSDKQSAVIVQLMKRLSKVGCPTGSRTSTDHHHDRPTARRNTLEPSAKP